MNTNADVKAESDACCTSSNAVEVVNGLDTKEIIFVPDKNLAAYVQTKTNKKIIPWDGFCYVHHRITGEAAKQALESNPGAKLIAHPECPQEVLQYADKICSTEKMVDFAKEHKNQTIILGTEIDMVNRLIKENPNNKYFTIGKICFNMKKTTLQSVLDSLEKNQHEITIPEKIRINAKKAIDRMI